MFFRCGDILRKCVKLAFRCSAMICENIEKRGQRGVTLISTYRTRRGGIINIKSNLILPLGSQDTVPLSWICPLYLETNLAPKGSPFPVSLLPLSCSSNSLASRSNSWTGLTSLIFSKSNVCLISERSRNIWNSTPAN